MPILFALPGGSVFWGILTDIELDRAATRLFFEGFEKLSLPSAAPLGLKRWTGQPLDATPPSTYSLCFTPEFLLEAAPVSATAMPKGTAVAEPPWPVVPQGSWLDRMRSRRADETAGENWEISGRQLVNHLLLRHQQQEADGAKGSKANLNLDLVVHAIHNPEPAAALPALLKILKSKDVFYKCVAAECLRHLGPAEVTAVDFLLEKLKDNHKDLRAAVVQCLLQIGPTTKASLPLLIEALRDDEERIRTWAVASLRKIGPLAAPAIDALLRAMHGTNVELRLRIIAALAAIGGAAAKVVPSLARALEHKDPAVRAQAVKALAHFGPAAASALPALAVLAQRDKNSQIRALASAAMARIRGKSAPPGDRANAP
jgi:HEAT repeat protein